MQIENKLPMINIGVIIVNYNSTDLLRRSLLALQEQTLQAKRIIVVDNASVPAISLEFKQEFNQVEFIQLQDNIGFAAANNLGAKQLTDCEWIALLNPDAFPEPEWLAVLARTTLDYPEYRFFGSHMLNADDPKYLDGTGDVYHVSGRAWRRQHGCLAKAQTLQHPEEIFAPCAAAALYHREAFLQIDGFDENYFCYFEDIDLGFRLRLKGERCLYVPQAVVKHMGSAVTGKHSDFYVYHGQRNLVWTFVKNMPGLLFWIYLPEHLLLNLASILWFTWQGQGKCILRAKWHALKHLPRVWRQRKHCQQNKVSALAIYRLMAKGLPIPREN